MTAQELEKFKHSYRNWLAWFRDKVDSGNPLDLARRLGVKVPVLREWYDGKVTPPLCTRIGIMAMIDDTAGPCDWKASSARPAKPMPANVDLTRPLHHLQAEFGGSLNRFVAARLAAGVSIRAGKPVKPHPPEWSRTHT